MSHNSLSESENVIRPENAIPYLLSQAPHETAGAWKLSRNAARTLREHVGASPPGGWEALAQLSCGAFLQAKRDKFTANMTLWDFDQLETSEVRRRLADQFARRLVPPTTAAGLFIMLRIHPAWGVHIAHQARKKEGGNSAMFPVETRHCVTLTVNVALRDIINRLQTKEPEQKYPTPELTDIVSNVVDGVRQMSEAFPRSSNGLDPFVDSPDVESGSWRASDFVRNDLLDAWLVPAGIAYRENGRFHVTQEGAAALKKVKVLPE